jgi:hypothetical protein
MTSLKFKPQERQPKQQLEYHLQKQICQWLSIQYPKVLFLSDTVASVKLTIPQQVRNKAIQKHGFKCPDLIIFEPRNEWHGLMIELKKETPYKKNGVIKASQDGHLEKQEQTLIGLVGKGYYTSFAWSFEMAKEIITNYLT